MLHVAAVEEPYDAIVFGSSRLYRGVKPDTFDAECGKLGNPVYSFNAAMAGAVGHEVSVTIEELLAEMSSLPKHAIIELIHWGPVIADANLMSDRVLLWHRPTDLPSIFRSMMLHLPRPQQLTLSEHVHQGWAHFEHAVRHTFRVGRGVAIVREALHPRYPNPGKTLRGKYRGWKAFDISNGGVARRAKVFAKTAARYEAYAKRVAEAIPDRLRFEVNWGSLHAQLDLLRGCGVEPIYVLAPTIGPRLSREERQKLRELVVLLDYSEPSEWPEFFNSDVRFDASHLNAAGAELFSQQLARDYVRVCSQGRGK